MNRSPAEQKDLSEVHFIDWRLSHRFQPRILFGHFE